MKDSKQHDLATAQQKYTFRHSEWVDYSDSDSADESSPSEPHDSPPPQYNKSPPPAVTAEKKRYRPSKEEVRRQLDLLDRLDDRRVDEVWLDIFS